MMNDPTESKPVLARIESSGRRWSEVIFFDTEIHQWICWQKSALKWGIVPDGWHVVQWEYIDKIWDTLTPSHAAIATPPALSLRDYLNNPGALQTREGRKVNFVRHFFPLAALDSPFGVNLEGDDLFVLWDYDINGRLVSLKTSTPHPTDLIFRKGIVPDENNPSAIAPEPVNKESHLGG